MRKGTEQCTLSVYVSMLPRIVSNGRLCTKRISSSMLERFLLFSFFPPHSCLFRITSIISLYEGLSKFHHQLHTVTCLFGPRSLAIEYPERTQPLDFSTHRVCSFGWSRGPMSEPSNPLGFWRWQFLNSYLISTTCGCKSGLSC